MGKTHDILDQLTGNKDAEETVEETPVTPEVEPKEDRSAYNCTACGGEGITFPPAFPEGKLCDICHATGKV